MLETIKLHNKNTDGVVCDQRETEENNKHVLRRENKSEERETNEGVMEKRFSKTLEC